MGTYGSDKDNFRGSGFVFSIQEVSSTVDQNLSIFSKQIKETVFAKADAEINNAKNSSKSTATCKQSI
jgi:hypothetical protein